MKVCQAFFGSEFPSIRGAVFGTELEIESVHSVDTDKFAGSLKEVVEDPSLRNYGTELVSNPLSFVDTLRFFKYAYSGALKFHNKAEAHSHRTSTHVHVNVMDLSLTEVRNLIINYFLLEKGFFDLVDSSRQNNIYCVPLSATNLLSRLATQNIVDMCSSSHWHKYAAFNLLPLTAQGTIEFRHLQGTDDYATFEKWLTSILCWRATSGSVPRSFEDSLSMFKEVFGKPATAEQQEAMHEAWLTYFLSSTPMNPETLIFRIQENQVCVD